jgi:hypothetical protein
MLNIWKMGGWYLLTMKIQRLLVGGVEHEIYDFPYIGHVIIPADEVHHFSEE